MQMMNGFLESVEKPGLWWFKKRIRDWPKMALSRLILQANCAEPQRQRFSIAVSRGLLSAMGEVDPFEALSQFNNMRSFADIKPTPTGYLYS